MHWNTREQLNRLHCTILHGRVKDPDLRQALELSLGSLGSGKKSYLQLAQDKGVAYEPYTVLRYLGAARRWEHHAIHLYDEIKATRIFYRDDWALCRLAIVPPQLAIERDERNFVAEPLKELCDGQACIGGP
jgi:hypothetical protein